MRATAFALLVAMPVVAGDRKIPPPTACNDEYAECKDSCSVEFGTSYKVRDKLKKCVGKCQTTHTDCRDRWFELQSAGIDPTEGVAKKKDDGPTRFSDLEEKPPEPAEPPKRTATRVADPEPEPEPAPAPKAKPEAKREQEPAPPPP